jgi:IstB-like ATP binding protein
MPATTATRDLTAELAFLTRALKAPTLRQSVARLAERARGEGWSHEEFLAACLQREVAAREAHGGEGRIRAARFPARKSLEEFDDDHARGLKRKTIVHLGTLDFVTARENVVFLGPPGTGKRPPPRSHDRQGSVFTRRHGVSFRPSLTGTRAHATSIALPISTAATRSTSSAGSSMTSSTAIVLCGVDRDSEAGRPQANRATTRRNRVLKATLQDLWHRLPASDSVTGTPAPSTTDVGERPAPDLAPAGRHRRDIRDSVDRG